MIFFSIKSSFCNEHREIAVINTFLKFDKIKKQYDLPMQIFDQGNLLYIAKFNKPKVSRYSNPILHNNR